MHPIAVFVLIVGVLATLILFAVGLEAAKNPAPPGTSEPDTAPPTPGEEVPEYGAPERGAQTTPKPYDLILRSEQNHYVRCNPHIRTRHGSTPVSLVHGPFRDREAATTYARLWRAKYTGSAIAVEAGAETFIAASAEPPFLDLYETPVKDVR